MTYRRNNGRRLGQAGLADRIAQEINGMMLAQAFVIARAGDCRLIVNKLDGVPHRPSWSGRGSSTIYVDVILGIVRKSLVHVLHT
jgi:hypothetical protein